MIELGVQLSSITLCIGMDPSIRSAPYRCDRGKKLLDLDEGLLLRIAQFMDGKFFLISYGFFLNFSTNYPRSSVLYFFSITPHHLYIKQFAYR